MAAVASSTIVAFRPYTDTWTYVAGGVNLNGVYGTQGAAAANNFPGGRWVQLRESIQQERCGCSGIWIRQCNVSEYRIAE